MLKFSAFQTGAIQALPNTTDAEVAKEVGGRK